MMAVKEERQIYEIIEKLLQLCFSDRKFVMSAKILVQAISEMVLTMVKYQ
jgi:hypothetical protein